MYNPTRRLLLRTILQNISFIITQVLAQVPIPDSPQPTNNCPANSKFDLNWRTCVGLPGYPCVNYACDTNSECHNNLCKCKLGYTLSPSGLCLGSYGTPCNYTIPAEACSHEFACRYGRCFCKYTNYQFYDAERNQCLSFLGGPCTTDTQCEDKNAECVTQSGSQNISTCQCKKGLIEANGRCEIAFGEVCTGSTYFGLPCDTIAQLDCIDGLCQCNFLEFYDKTKNKCRGLVGSVCFKPLEGYCTDNAFCASKRNINVGEQYGNCMCNASLKATADRKCIETE